MEILSDQVNILKNRNNLFFCLGSLNQTGREFNSSNAASLKGKLQTLEVYILKIIF